MCQIHNTYIYTYINTYKRKEKRKVTFKIGENDKKMTFCS